MTNNETESNSTSIPVEVNKPWIIYPMSIWVFFGLGSYLNTLVRVIGRDNQNILQYGSIAILVLTIIIIFYILKMNRKAIITFGVLCVILAIWQTINLISILLSEGNENSIIYFLPYYIVPSTLLAVAALRPSFLQIASKYTEYQKFISTTGLNS